MWSKKHGKCVVCGTTNKKHKGLGMCRRCYDKNRRKENPEKFRENDRKWRKENIEKSREKCRTWWKKTYKENPEKFRERSKKQYYKNPKKYKENSAKWRKKNPEKYKEMAKKCRKKNFIKYKERNKEWYKEHPEYNRNYLRKKRKDNYHYKLRINISGLINQRLHSRLSSKNGKSTFSFLPYTVEQLKAHLEKQFDTWMNWENWGKGKGKWNIDHVRPDCKFDYKNVEDEEFQKCWALKNLQPLWAEENLRKGGR